MKDTKTPKHHRAWVLPEEGVEEKADEGGTRKERAWPLTLSPWHSAQRPAHSLRSVRANPRGKTQLSQTSVGIAHRMGSPRMHRGVASGQGAGDGEWKAYCRSFKFTEPRTKARFL